MSHEILRCSPQVNSEPVIFPQRAKRAIAFAALEENGCRRFVAEDAAEDADSVDGIFPLMLARLSTLARPDFP
jgi:hypothetical protein